MSAEMTVMGMSAEEWSLPRARVIIQQFADWGDDMVNARMAKEKIDKQEALAKAESVGVVHIPDSPRSDTDRQTESVGWAAHAMQPWTADEERYATTTLAALRTQHAKTRKARSRFAGDPPSSWNVLSGKATKLTPEGAAEMARARVAAAAAAAAMQTPEAMSPKPNEASPTGDAEERTSAEFDATPYTNAMFRRTEGAISRRHSLSAQASASDAIGEQATNGKRVEFAPDTVFDRPKSK